MELKESEQSYKKFKIMVFANSYEDVTRAQSYASLEFPNTYYLAYRDLPRILKAYANGNKALDFGCGAGRSTRFLEKHGFVSVGVDISEEMILQAKLIDPKGNYRLVKEADFSGFESEQFDVVVCVFTFDNIPTETAKEKNLKALKALLKEDGKIILLVSNPEIYTHEWASFSTRDFPENWKAKSGDKVQIIMTDVPDRRPVEDVVCSGATYRKIFKSVGLDVEIQHQPLGNFSEGINWLNEIRIAPWSIYVLTPLKQSLFYKYKYIHRL